MEYHFGQFGEVGRLGLQRGVYTTLTMILVECIDIKHKPATAGNPTVLDSLVERRRRMRIYRPWTSCILMH